jgi:ABC-type nitrate/sulfonate/bicarbonate transport system ATPase subunit
MSHAPALALRGVSKRFGSLPVLDAVDLDVAPGALVALLGPSGCGKTTLLHLLAGLHDPDAGTITLDGRAPAGRRGLTAYQPQKDLLLPWRTALGNAALGARLAGRRPEEARRLAAAMLDRVGLAGFERYYPAALSGGMRQRVALARTLLLDRGILLLDEPFAAVDQLTRLDLHPLLLGLWAERRPTSLLVTHDLDEACLLADRVVVLSGRPGRVVGEAEVEVPHPRRIDDPRLARLKGRLLALLRGAPVAAEAARA